MTDPGDDDAAATLWHEQTRTPLDRIAVLGRLFVSYQARGHRLGERLAIRATQAAQDQERRTVLDVMAKDAAAIATYERLGWQQIGKITHAVRGSDPVPASGYVSPPPGE